jgi:hypothetical protein
MIDRDSLPTNLRGDHYLIDDPGVEFYNAAGMSIGTKLLVRNENGEWREAVPGEINKVPLAIHNTFREGVARGLAERVRMLIMPASAAVDACHFRLLGAQNLKADRITEDESSVRIKGVNIANPLLRSDRPLEVVVSNELQERVIRAAAADGEFLFEKEI